VTPTFTLPPGSEAGVPPEERGLSRDEVRLMAVSRKGIGHHLFRDLPDLLEPGDLVVVNTSATLPARVDARRADGRIVPLHVSTQLDDGTWVVEVRRPANDGPDPGVEPGTVLTLPGGVRLRLDSAFPDAGHRVVAVGTTVTRALETATDDGGVTRPAAGWTDVVLGPDRPARAVTGLVTGLHAPEASHLLLLEAVAGQDLVRRAYAAAVEERYLWHEFGDSMLFLP
jgi:S-adenosylmethionine:tRNA-ribosyltransferase-isomerase (queuine synthetase)